jgi:hypothetical protein
VLGHDHVSADIEPVPTAHALQFNFDQIPGLRRGQQRLAMVITEGNEMQAARLLKTFQSPRHAAKITSTDVSVCDVGQKIPTLSCPFDCAQGRLPAGKTRVGHPQ